MTLLALTFATVLIGQPLAPYAGDWVADFQGTTYLRLALTEKAGSLQGAMSIGKSIHVDKQGNVDGAVEAESTLTPLLDVRRSNESWSFSVQHGDDLDRFEFRAIDAGTAELALLLSPEERQELVADGVPLPKPFRLTRPR